MGLLVVANKHNLDECRGPEGVGRRKYKHFGVQVMVLLEATSPSAGNCPIDMNKVSYKVVATYLS